MRATVVYEATSFDVTDNVAGETICFWFSRPPIADVVVSVVGAPWVSLVGDTNFTASHTLNVSGAGNTSMYVWCELFCVVPTVAEGGGDANASYTTGFTVTTTSDDHLFDALEQYIELNVTQAPTMLPAPAPTVLPAPAPTVLPAPAPTMVPALAPTIMSVPVPTATVAVAVLETGYVLSGFDCDTDFTEEVQLALAYTMVELLDFIDSIDAVTSINCDALAGRRRRNLLDSSDASLLYTLDVVLSDFGYSDDDTSALAAAVSAEITTKASDGTLADALVNNAGSTLLSSVTIDADASAAYAATVTTVARPSSTSGGGGDDDEDEADLTALWAAIAGLVVLGFGAFMYWRHLRAKKNQISPLFNNLPPTTLDPFAPIDPVSDGDGFAGIAISQPGPLSQTSAQT